jgi:hypothetical protein
MLRKIKKEENHPLSDSEIRELMRGKCNIVVYPDITQYSSLEQLLGSYGVCFLLYESKPKYGHWTLILLLDNGEVEFFNSYGGKSRGLPDESLLLIDRDFRKQSNQEIHYLSLLLLKSGYKLNYNEIQMQGKKQNIKTCGRHCVVRAHLKNLDLYQYRALMEKLCEKTGLDIDGVVTLLTIKKLD